MNQSTLLWLFGGAFGGIGALFVAITVLKIQMTGLQTTQDTLIRLLGNKAAFLLHSPHTPELDALIDKFRRDHITDTEMQEFCDILIKIESDLTANKGERLLASLVLLAIERIDISGQKKFNVGNSASRHQIHPNGTEKQKPPTI